MDFLGLNASATAMQSHTKAVMMLIMQSMSVSLAEETGLPEKNTDLRQETKKLSNIQSMPSPRSNQRVIFTPKKTPLMCRACHLVGTT